MANLNDTPPTTSWRQNKIFQYAVKLQYWGELAWGLFAWGDTKDRSGLWTKEKL